jgi:hypothetical protein
MVTWVHTNLSALLVDSSSSCGTANGGDMGIYDLHAIRSICWLTPIVEGGLEVPCRNA